MSVQPEDRTTIDMFSEIRPGRPRSNPYDRTQQCRFNKRSQRLRDKHAGLHRLEVKLPGDVVAALDEASEELGLSRAEVISKALEQWLHL
ncbi:MAG: LexA regulated protein [Thalassolituus sp.]